MTTATTVSIPQDLYEKLKKEAERRHADVADIIELAFGGVLPPQFRGFDTKLLKDLLALAHKFQGPKDLSQTYKQTLYGKLQ